MERIELSAEIELLTNRIHEELSLIAKLLTERKAHVAAAESLTGGMISSAFVDIPGSSNWFSDGFVTYSNEAKVRRLGVSAELIENNTAVDSEVALQMAQGALKISGADYAVAVTGLAGPFEDENGTPYPLDPRHEAGLVFVAVAAKSGAAVSRCVFSGSRTAIRKRTVLKAVQMLKRVMQNGL